jgi:hypothetical protein
MMVNYLKECRFSTNETSFQTGFGGCFRPGLAGASLVPWQWSWGLPMRYGDLVRMARILGMLGSDHEGERASAALAAHRLLKITGSSWVELLMPGREPAGGNPRRRFVDILHDPLSAAESRIRQLRRENDELRAEVKRLKLWLDSRRPAPRDQRAQA